MEPAQTELGLDENLFAVQVLNKVFLYLCCCACHNPYSLLRSFMRVVFLLLFCTLFGTALWAQAVVKKGTHQTIPVPEGIQTVRVNLDPELVQVRTTRSNRIIVESTVSMSGSMALLDYTIGTGRYNMITVTEGNVLVIAPAPRKQDIIIRGEVMQESIHYTVYIPETLEQKAGANAP